MNKQLTDILQKNFGLEAFREGQEEIIECIVQKNDTLVFMPTGGGKSLTYQLPGMVLEGITIVISPLISLMKDQVDKLKVLGIRAELINSTLSGSEKAEIMHELRYYDSTDPQAIKFLYIAPERLNSREFVGILKTVKIALVAIDEAHCISQWGHDFRPSYMKIKGFIEGLEQDRSFPIVGLTATATEKVRVDIVERLGLTKFRSFISGFDRKNIIIVVREISAKDEKQSKVLDIIEKTPGTGIIYCSSRKHVTEVTDYLVGKGIKAGIYKGDLSPEVRAKQQDKFMNDEYKVMVATNAFGMGIDKKDIRFVIHYNLPGSIENYYQEVGRAGRDGKKSFGIVLASYGDTKIQEFFIDNTYPSKKQILDFYDYLYKENKLGEGVGTRVAKTYYVMASESQVGTDMIVGSIIKILEKHSILRKGLEETDTENDFRGRGLTLLQEKRQHSHVLIDWKRQELLKDEAYYKLEQIKRLLFYPSCRKKFILEYFGDKEDIESLGDNCGLCDYCLESGKFSEEDLEKVLPSSSYGIALEIVKKYNEKFGQSMFSKVLQGSEEKRILDWNLDLYEHYGALKEYSNNAVNAIFEALQMEGFLFKTEGKYPLLGTTELGGAAVYKDKYLKDRILDLNKYVLQKAGKDIGKTSKSSAKISGIKKASTPRGQTYKETLELFKAGKNTKEISKQRELGAQTIESHIVTLYEQGEVTLMDVLKLVDFDTAKIIKQVIESDAILENTGLKAVKEALETLGRKDITYFQIKLTLAMRDKKDI